MKYSNFEQDSNRGQQRGGVDDSIAKANGQAHNAKECEWKGTFSLKTPNSTMNLEQLHNHRRIPAQFDRGEKRQLENIIKINKYTQIAREKKHRIND